MFNEAPKQYKPMEDVVPHPELVMDSEKAITPLNIKSKLDAHRATLTEEQQTEFDARLAQVDTEHEAALHMLPFDDHRVGKVQQLQKTHLQNLAALLGLE